MMTAEQLRAARALLRWDQAHIAEKAAVSVETVKRFEKMDGPLLEARGATVAAIQAAFEREGVEFTNGGTPGVRLVRRGAEVAGASKASAARTSSRSKPRQKPSGHRRKADR